MSTGQPTSGILVSASAIDCFGMGEMLALTPLPWRSGGQTTRSPASSRLAGWSRVLTTELPGSLRPGRALER